MIKNKKQYSLAKANLIEYDKVIEDQIKELKFNEAHPIEIEMKANILNAQKEKLEIEINEYESLLENNEIVIKNIYDLPKAIIKARLKMQCSQSELAKKIDVAEQQIQRYEAQDYNKANLERVIQIINALDINISIVLKPRSITKVIKLKHKQLNQSNLFRQKRIILERKTLMLMGE